MFSGSTGSNAMIHLPPLLRQRRCFLLSLLAGMMAATTAGSPAHAGSQKDIEELSDMIKASGTSIVVKECGEKDQGIYEYSEKPKIDQLTICKNNVDLTDADALWEVLAHEATHIMQACNGGPIVKDEFHPRIIRRLKTQAPHYSTILEEEYRGADMLLEAEAFDMELQTPEYVKEWFANFCLKQSTSDR